MNKRNLKFLYELDMDTLKEIARKEQENANSKNVYYDFYTKEAIIYPEDDKLGLEIRPLHRRLLKNGVRLNTEVAKLLADTINYALKESNQTINQNLLSVSGNQIAKMVKKDDNKQESK